MLFFSVFFVVCHGKEMRKTWCVIQTWVWVLLAMRDKDNPAYASRAYFIEKISKSKLGPERE